MIALVTGGAVAGGSLFLTGCKSANSADAGFSPENIAFLDEVGETIIPATDTPGAKAAQIGKFMQVMVSDCYTKKERDNFMKAFEGINKAADKQFNKDFLSLSAEQRKQVLLELEKEAQAYNKKRDDDERPKKEAWEKKNSTISWKDQVAYEPEPLHYYSLVKQLTLMGFFTSKTGMTETLRHVAVPGRYDGNAPYKKGEKAWAE